MQWVRKGSRLGDKCSGVRNGSRLGDECSRYGIGHAWVTEDDIFTLQHNLRHLPERFTEQHHDFFEILNGSYIIVAY